MTILKRGREVLERWTERSGQALVEYALLAAAVVTLVVSLSLLFGPSVGELLGRVGAHVSEQAGRLAGSDPAPEDGGGSGGRGNGGGGSNKGGNGNNGAPAPGNSPGTGNNPGVGNNPGNGSGIGSGNNPGKGRGQ